MKGLNLRPWPTGLNGSDQLKALSRFTFQPISSQSLYSFQLPPSEKRYTDLH